jgi:hypothetical protein
LQQGSGKWLLESADDNGHGISHISDIPPLPVFLEPQVNPRQRKISR